MIKGIFLALAVLAAVGGVASVLSHPASACSYVHHST